MKQNQGIIFKINKFSILRIVKCILSLGWIVFSIYMFAVNPLFFSISSFIVLLNTLTDFKREFILTVSHLKIIKRFPIPFLNRSECFGLNEIASIDYKEGEIDQFGIILTFFGLAAAIKSRSYLILKLKNELTINYITDGYSKEFKYLVQLINKK